MTDGDASAASLGELVAGLAHWSPDADGQEAARLRAGDVACAVHLGGSLPQWVAARQAYGRLLGEGTGGCWLGAELASCCRITEIDDIDLRTCTTPGSVAVPAALVFASQGAGTADVLAGIAAGYEVILAAAAALGGAFATAAGTWPTRAAAALGAAAAAGRTIGLSPDGMVEACALAGGSAATGVSPEPARSFSLGMAVAQGIAAAVAAAEGLRGDRRMLERWSSAHGRADFPAVLPAPPGPAVTRSMCKPFAGARQVLAGSTTLRSLVERGEIDPLAVVGIELGVAPLHAAMVDRPSIQHRLDTLASAQYQLATALDRPAHLDVLDQPRPPDAALERRMRTVRVVADETLARAFPDRWGARLEIELRHGRARQVVDGVAGESAFGWEELAGKVRRLAGANLAGDGDTAADPLLQLLHAARDDRWADLLAALLRVMLRQQEEGERCDD